ncbi:MAG TPA: type VI secretion system domain-containing protein, partial [Longimicrobium sp.]|nr:type VI secretion system domain-containing protein [Longimicrobium sp.]
ETLAWLRESGFTAVDGDENEEGGEPSPAPRASSPEDRARAQAAAGQAGRAVEILLDAADRERSARARFLLRTRAAEVMVDAGLEAVAAPILREMVEQVQRHALEAWETGEVVARPLALLCRCLDRVGGAPGEREPLYLRVCRLDPVRAIQLGGGADAAS